MEEINGHKVNECNDGISIFRLDGGDYDLIMGNGAVRLKFHEGTVQCPADCNGLTVEALLAVVIDRMQTYQKSQFSCRENSLAITKLEEAKLWLLSRTLERKQRGVEGTHQK